MPAKDHQETMRSVTIILISAFLLQSAYALPVFPDAVGFGTDTRAAYGGDEEPEICIVINLDPTGGQPTPSTRDGKPVFEGTFEQCLDHVPVPVTAGNSKGKVILFETSGTIDMQNRWVNLDTPYTTIAGQSAPSPGITLRGTRLDIRTHDVLIQHIRSRVGDEDGSTSCTVRNAIMVTVHDDDLSNIVVDHVSASWGTDQVSGVGRWGSAPQIYGVTFSNMIISEGLEAECHNKEDHSMGLLIGDCVTGISIIGNLFANNKRRNPLVKGGTAVVVNNVMYNTHVAGTRFSNQSCVSKISVVGNHHITGPRSSTTQQYVFSLWGKNIPYIERKAYLNDNQCESCLGHGWDGAQDKHGAMDVVKVDSAPIWLPGFTARPVADVKNAVLDNAGARPLDRDAVDERIVWEVENDEGDWIKSQDDVKDPDWSDAWPPLIVNETTLDIPDNPHVYNGEYTNLELWLHDLASALEPEQTGQPAVPVCRQGIISTECDCSGIVSDTGHCCEGSWQLSACQIENVFSPVERYGDRLNWEEQDKSRWGVFGDGELGYGLTQDFNNETGERLGEYSLVEMHDDFVFKAKVKTLERLAENNAADYAIVFGYIDDENYYYFLFNGRQYNNKLEKVSGGVREDLETSDFVIADEEFHDVLLVKKGIDVIVGYDDERFTTTMDVNQVGRVGIGGFNDRSLWDDIDIKVIHRADMQDYGCVDMDELIPFMDRWKESSTWDDGSGIEVVDIMVAISIWVDCT